MIFDSKEGYTVQNIRLFAFGETNAQQLAAYREALVQTAPALFAETAEFTAFQQKRPLVAALSTAFEQAQLILLCVAAPVFLPLKALLLDSMALGSFTDPLILERLAASDCPPQEQSAHARIPLQAQPFLTQDGRFSGFAAQEGAQIFLYLPFLPAQESLGEGLAEYLQSLTEQAPQVQTEAEEAQDNLPLLAQRTVSLLFAAGADVALSETETAPYFRRAVSALSGNEKLFQAAEDDTPQGTMPPKEYFGLLAKQAREQQNAVLGVAVSPVMNAAQEKDASQETREEYVYLALADKTHVRVLQFYAGADEPREALLDSALAHLLGLLLDYAKEKGFAPPKALAQPEFEEKKSRFSPVYAFAAAAAVLLCLLIVLFAKAAGSEDEAATTTAAAVTAPTTAQDIADWMEKQQLRENIPPIAQTTAQTTVQTTASTTATSTTALSVLTTILTTTKPAVTTAREKQSGESDTAAKSTAAAPATKAQPKASGDFVFRVYGFGHGVGMSQMGAVALAQQGESAAAILAHYFPGTSIAADSKTPKTVTYAGKEYALAEYLVRTAEAEIGASAPKEAFRAQAILAYTAAARRDFQGLGTGTHALSAGEPKKENLQTVLGLLGMKNEQDSPKGSYLAADGKAALAPYFSGSAGQTVSSISVWGGAQSENPHLRGGISSPETVQSSEKIISAAELRELVEAYNKSDACKTPITLDGDPADWLEIIRHDGAVNKKTGYVEEIRVGNVKMTGNHFRYYVLDLALRSHCFEVSARQ